MEISDFPTFKNHPTIKFDGTLYGAHDSLFTCWRNLATGEQVTDFAVSDELDKALLRSKGL